MHKILVNTHKESNINLLKARDYYFDKARFINNYLRKLCLIIPIVLSVLSMFAQLILGYYKYADVVKWLEENGEVIIGCTTIVVFLIDSFLKQKVDTNLSVSNALRELYDVKVLGIMQNKFYYHYTEKEIQNFLEKSNHVKDKGKYEVWYQEIFSNNDFSNAICCMLDNVIYTYHVYSANMKRLLRNLIIIFSIYVIYCVVYVVLDDGLVFLNPFILFLAIFDYIKDTVDSYLVSKDLSNTNKELKNAVIEKADELMSKSTQDEACVLRCIQDVIVDYREKGLFIPKRIRNKYMQYGSEFYKDLDLIKNIFWNKDKVYKPVNANDFEICTVENENETTNLYLIHNELKRMLEDVKACLDKNNKSFLLDGGTLIGAYRKSNQHRFLAWDDDVDIAVRSDEVEEIKKVIENEFKDKYVIQDYMNEEFYSPRLSTFRIRQKNERSWVCEKDSELYENYKNHGLFLDVYAYCPILGCKCLDSLYRYIFIHPLNWYIRKIEFKCNVGQNSSKKKMYSKFRRMKKIYIKRVNWYLKYAKNEKYMAYEPFYIYDLKKAGPYIKKEDLFGNVKKCVFEGKEYRIPTDSEKVLSQYFGNDWETSPLQIINDLKEKNLDWIIYSKNKFDASSYKHLKRASVYGYIQTYIKTDNKHDLSSVKKVVLKLKRNSDV